MSGLILLASYPKSGNTWLRFVLDSLQRGGAAVDINSAPFVNAAARSAIDRLLGMESADLRESHLAAMRPQLWTQAAQQSTEPVILKVHDAFAATPLGPKPFEAASVRAVIYIVRDPRDVAISMAHHMGISFDETVATMADESYWLSAEPDRHRPNLPQFLSSWSRHVESWLDSALPLTLLRYETMRRDPVSAFADAFTAAGFELDMNILQRAVAAAHFEGLQQQEQAHGFAENLPGATSNFFRRGEAGAWRGVLTPDQARRIEIAHGAVMGRLGYA